MYSIKFTYALCGSERDWSYRINTTIRAIVMEMFRFYRIHPIDPNIGKGKNWIPSKTSDRSQELIPPVAIVRPIYFFLYNRTHICIMWQWGRLNLSNKSNDSGNLYGNVWTIANKSHRSENSLGKSLEPFEKWYRSREILPLQSLQLACRGWPQQAQWS